MVPFSRCFKQRPRPGFPVVRQYIQLTAHSRKQVNDLQLGINKQQSTKKAGCVGRGQKWAGSRGLVPWWVASASCRITLGVCSQRCGVKAHEIALFTLPQHAAPSPGSRCVVCVAPPPMNFQVNAISPHEHLTSSQRPRCDSCSVNGA